jgi:ABC-type phosphate transport system substrate-binding protein
MTHNGLSNEAAEARLRQCGPNALPERPPTPLWRRFTQQFQSPLIYILLFALVADAAIWVSEGATGLPVESIASAVILLLNAGLGVYLVIQNIGSDTMVNLAQAWAEEYSRVEPAVSVEVSGGGAGTGVATLINGTADIANCSRQMEAGEIAKASGADRHKPKENIVGYDALAIFAHRDNPLEEITIGQLAAIYGEKGPVRLGVQVPGCQSGEMILVSRQSNSGTYHYFRSSLR